MNKIQKPVYFILFMIILNAGYGQDSIYKDPLLKRKYFTEENICIYSSNVYPYYSVFQNNGQTYSFIKNNNLLTYDAGANLGILFHKKNNGFDYTDIFKFGIRLVYQAADLKDSSKNNLRYEVDYIQIPMSFGFRTPIRYNTVKNNLFRAIEYNIGLYVSIPVSELLYNKDNNDYKEDIHWIFADNFKFGCFIELAYTALNKKGYGHKFGIRASSDFNSIIKIKDTYYNLYPYFANIGLFYNLFNGYSKN